MGRKADMLIGLVLCTSVMVVPVLADNINQPPTSLASISTQPEVNKSGPIVTKPIKKSGFDFPESLGIALLGLGVIGIGLTRKHVDKSIGRNE